MLLQLLLSLKLVPVVVAVVAVDAADWCFCAASPQVEIADVLRNLFAQLNWKVRYVCCQRALYSVMYSCCVSDS